MEEMTQWIISKRKWSEESEQGRIKSEPKYFKISRYKNIYVLLLKIQDFQDVKKNITKSTHVIEFDD